MVPLVSLAGPIVLSAVIVFVASAVLHMVLPFHRTDLKALPREGEVQEALRSFAIPPGDYGLPHPGSMAGMKAPRFLERMARGPVAFMTVRPSGQTPMAAGLVRWFVYTLVISVFAGYVAGRAVPAGGDRLDACRFASTTAFMGYAMALPQQAIWYGRSWMTTIKSMVDGLLYGLLTGVAFWLLWPR